MSDGAAHGEVRQAALRSDLGYRSEVDVYRAVNCKGCPLRGMCYSSVIDRRSIKVNHRSDSSRSTQGNCSPANAVWCFFPK
ncbi:MAG: transposase [Coprobacter fastidiosus]